MDGPGATRILLTAFGAFPGARVNPTLEIAAALARAPRLRRLGIAIETRALPVVYADIAGALSAAVTQTRPQAIIHLGLAGRRTWVSVETRAVNRIGPLRPDAARRRSPQMAVAPVGAQALRARWPAERLRVAMTRTGAPTRISIDAGDYLCNQALYLTLASSSAPAGFIHVPRPKRRDAKKRSVRPTISELVRAVEAAVVLMAVECRRGRS